MGGLSGRVRRLVPAACLCAAAFTPMSHGFGVHIQIAAEPRLEADAALERRMRDRVLRDRRAEGHGALAWDSALVAAAREHDRDMALHGFVGHVSPTRGGPDERLTRAGYHHRSVRENIAVAPSVEEAERGFLDSPHHHENLMAEDVTRFGIGIVHATDERGNPTLYVTQLFATPYAPPSPDAVETALRRAIDAARGKAGRPGLQSSPALSQVARSYISRLEPPVAPTVLSEISQAAIRRTQGSEPLGGIAVSVQTAFEAGDVEVPDAALGPDARWIGEAAVRRTGPDGQPRVVILLLVGQAREP